MIEYVKDGNQNLNDNTKTIIVQYYADWCGPCQKLKPILEQISSEMSDIVFYRVDIEEFRDLAVDQNIKSIPTVVMSKNGTEVGRMTGFKPKHLVEEWINTNK